MPDEIKIQRAWFGNLLTPQTIVYLFAGMIAVVIFWMKTKDNWDETKKLKEKIEVLEKEKASKTELNSLGERVNRQYETTNKVQDRVIVVEKELEYQRGYKEAEQSKKP